MGNLLASQAGMTTPDQVFGFLSLLSREDSPTPPSPRLQNQATVVTLGHRDVLQPIQVARFLSFAIFNSSVLSVYLFQVPSSFVFVFNIYISVFSFCFFFRVSFLCFLAVGIDLLYKIFHSLLTAGINPNKQVIHKGLIVQNSNSVPENRQEVSKAPKNGLKLPKAMKAC